MPWRPTNGRATNAASINGDPKHLALAGESAGGNLAIATAVAARDAGLQAPTHILAVYPVGQTGDLNTKSYVDSAVAKPLNKPMIEWFVDKLLAKPADKMDPRLDLIHANPKGLPPVTIINAQIDPLREYGTLLGAALKKAGVRVDRKSTAAPRMNFSEWQLPSRTLQTRRSTAARRSARRSRSRLHVRSDVALCSVAPGTRPSGWKCCRSAPRRFQEDFQGGALAICYSSCTSSALRRCEASEVRRQWRISSSCCRLCTSRQEMRCLSC